MLCRRLLMVNNETYACSSATFLLMKINRSANEAEQAINLSLESKQEGEVISGNVVEV